VTDAKIASPSNPRLKAVAKLRDRRERERTGLTIVDGGRETRRAVEAGVTVSDAFVCASLVRSEDARRAVAALRAAGVRTWEVTPPAFEKIAFGDRDDGLVVVVHAPSVDLAGLALPPDPLIVVLEAVEKPGNLGAALRTADGAGADALIAADPRTDLFNPNAIRASIGTAFTVPIAAGSVADVLTFLRERGIRIVAARVDATRDYADADLRGPVAIALGSEADGLTEAWSTTDVMPVRLPMLGAADSLNVSIAAAILLYEARRQRGVPSSARPRNRD
jgi:TrmH family RNA methyltransferase